MVVRVVVVVVETNHIVILWPCDNIPTSLDLHCFRLGGETFYLRSKVIQAGDWREQPICGDFVCRSHHAGLPLLLL